MGRSDRHREQPGPARRRWRNWRYTRPFWGGLLVTLGGIEILFSMRAPLPVILHIGPQGLAGYLVPTILLICGVLLLAHPSQRLFYATLSLPLALGSWLTSNLGGFIIGMLLALVGGSLAFAWTPRKQRQPAKVASPSPADHERVAGVDTTLTLERAEPDAGVEVPQARTGTEPAAREWTG